MNIDVWMFFVIHAVKPSNGVNLFRVDQIETREFLYRLDKFQAHFRTAATLVE